MSEKGLRKLFRINKIKILMSCIFGADSRIMNAQRWKLAEQQNNKPGYCQWYSCLQIQKAMRGRSH